jgi:hypothetical protein
VDPITGGQNQQNNDKVGTIFTAGWVHSLSGVTVVAENTAIFNMHGKQIPLSDLAVPCEATVQYRLIMDKSPVVMRLQVKSPLPGATVAPLLHLREK